MGIFSLLVCYTLYVKNKQKKTIQIGKKCLGRNHPILIQTMTVGKTSNVNEVVKQILECEKYGLDMIRVSVVDNDDVLALNKIKSKIHVPLIADLHFDKKLALAVLDQNIDKIRINPLNLKSERDYSEIICKARDKDIPVRLGFNEASVRSIEEMFTKAKYYIQLANALDFDNFVLSFKFSNVVSTIDVYRQAAKIFPYPLHVGVTESGVPSSGLIKSSAGLTPLLLEGIGNTIRISLTDKPVEEVKAAKRLLKFLGIIHDWPELISCPSCGRTEVNQIKVANEIQDFIEKNHIISKVAVMGCPVNGPGEAKHADIGIAGSKDNTWVLFKKGKIVRTIKGDDVIEEFKSELLRL